MNIYPNQLPGALKSGLTRCYWLCGDEILLMTEAADQIRQAASQQGFCERRIYTIDAQTPTTLIRNEIESFDLFTDKKILDLRFQEKPAKLWQTFCTIHLPSLSKEIILLIRTPKLDRATFNTQWFKAIAPYTTVVTIWPIKPEHFQAWLRTQAKKYQLTLATDALDLIASYTEGNLLAADQALQKLAITGDNTPEAIRASLSHDTRFDVYSLADAVFEGSKRRYARILNSLRQEGVAPTLIAYVLHQEIKKRLSVFEGEHQGTPLKTLFQQHQVWPNKQALFMRYFTQFDVRYLYEALADISTLDKTSKGLERGDIWQLLLCLCLKLNGVQTE